LVEKLQPPYGYGRAESLATAVVSLTLLGGAMGIAVAAVGEIVTPHHMPAPFTLIVIDRFDLVNALENNAIVATTEPHGLCSEIRVLFDRSRSSWGVYVPPGPRVELALELPSRFYHVEWIDPRERESPEVVPCWQQRPSFVGSCLSYVTV
jgi:hypothetical protein